MAAATEKYCSHIINSFIDLKFRLVTFTSQRFDEIRDISANTPVSNQRDIFNGVDDGKKIADLELCIGQLVVEHFGSFRL